MKNLVKKLLTILSGYLPFVRKYYIEWGLVGEVPMKVMFSNFIFQRILRLNSEVEIPVHFTSKIVCYEKMLFHHDRDTARSFSVSGGCYFQCLNGIVIGRNFLFAPGVKLISANHNVNDRDISVSAGPIVIGDDVWLGANTIILPEVKIGNRCVVGAGSVVTKSFEEDDLIIAGNPAKLIKKKSNSQERCGN